MSGMCPRAKVSHQYFLAHSRVIRSCASASGLRSCIQLWPLLLQGDSERRNRRNTDSRQVTSVPHTNLLQHDRGDVRRAM